MRALSLIPDVGQWGGEGRQIGMGTGSKSSGWGGVEWGGGWRGEGRVEADARLLCVYAHRSLLSNVLSGLYHPCNHRFLEDGIWLISHLSRGGGALRWAGGALGWVGWDG